MTNIQWNHTKFVKSVEQRAMDGCEECAIIIKTDAAERCPVDRGTMRASLGVERDDKKLCCYIGGGGPAKDYILRQHQDMSLNHVTGEAKFISNALEAHAKELPSMIKKHVG